MPDVSLDDEHVKTVFAHFGRAYYMANVFEIGLAIAILELEFLTGVIDQIKREGVHATDRARYQADFDAFLEQQHAQTLEGLLKRFRGLATLPPRLQKLVVRAKEKRDCLVHHFFRERDEMMVNRRGRDKLIAELDEAVKVFDLADRALEEFLRPHRDKLGFATYAARLEAHLKKLEENEDL